MGAVATSSSHPLLIYKDGEDRERSFPLEPGMTHATVGRVRSSDLVLDWDAQVSRLHAQLERSGDVWEVVDDGLSSNGTFVNGERLGGRRALSHGDVLSFGGTRVTYHVPGAEQVAPVAGARDGSSTVDLSTTQRRVLAALCRPYKGGRVFASPPTDQEIADELVLPVGAVTTHLAVLVAKLGVDDAPEDQRRARLAERAMETGAITDGDL
jgi:hypothetical protein